MNALAHAHVFAHDVRRRDKAARFAIARAEAAECDAALQMVDVVSLAAPSRVRRLRRRADRVGALLRGLVAREQALSG